MVLFCIPPYGKPQPAVTWFKNGKKITADEEKMKIDRFASLTINKFGGDDQGFYHCEASSIAGVRKSPLTTVSLLGKTLFQHFCVFHIAFHNKLVK